MVVLFGEAIYMNTVIYFHIATIKAGRDFGSFQTVIDAPTPSPREQATNGDGGGDGVRNRITIIMKYNTVFMGLRLSVSHQSMIG